MSTVGGASKSKTRTSSSIPLMRGGTSTTSAIPLMRSTGAVAQLPSNPALPASHVVASVRSDKLEEEAGRMEARLAALKVAMTTERAQRDALKRTRSGSFWKAADPAPQGKNYMEDAMARIEKRVAKSAAGAQSARPSNGATSARPLVKPTTTTPDMTATVKSSYVPPIQPKSTVSAPSVPRLQGVVSNGTTPAVASVPLRSTRKPVAAAAASSAAASSATAAAPATASAAASFVNPADDETRLSAPGSLLDGDFDEAENKRWFAAAREEWMAEPSTAAPAAGSTGKTMLVHDPDYSPAELATASNSGNSLLDGPAFNERESAKDFAEARRAWMQALEEEQAGGAPAAKSHKAKQTAEQQVDNSDGMWNPSIALGAGGSILFPSEETPVASARGNPTPAASTATVSSALRAAQSGIEKSAKSSCYSCYKLFYSAAALRHADFPTRQYCSQVCVDAAVASSKLKCAADGCARSVLSKDGRRLSHKQDQFFCALCADNDGVKPVSPPQPAPVSARSGGVAMGSLASSLDSIPHASSPELDDAEHADAELAGDVDDDDLDSGIPEAASPHQPFTRSLAGSRASSAARQRFTVHEANATPSVAAPNGNLSRPTSAAIRAVLDTSVIRQAPPSAPVAAVIEFPSDDDE